MTPPRSSLRPLRGAGPRRLPHTALAATGLLVAAALLSEEAGARVGGGEGFSSGSRSSSSSSGGSSDGGGELAGELLWLLIRLTFAYPEVMVPIWIVVGLAWFATSRFRRDLAGPAGATFDGGNPDLGRAIGFQTSGAFEHAWASLAAEDPALSRPVLEDHLQLVWRRAWAAAGDRPDEALATWVAPEVSTTLAGHLQGRRADDVVIAGLTITHLHADVDPRRLVVRFRGSRVERKDGEATHVYTEETWTFARPGGVRSPAPDAVHRMGCPACGAALQVDLQGRCTACGTAVTSGQLAWRAVEARVDLRRQLGTAVDEERGLLLHGHVDVEPGYRAPTVHAADLARTKRAWLGRAAARAMQGEGTPGADPLATFKARVEATFTALQDAWDRGDWDAARPWTTDTSWNTLRFWMERYKRLRLRNRVQGSAIEKMEVTRVTMDAWYESVTVRLWAHATDWVEDERGEVVSGHRERPRRFSEYWTFVRAVGAHRKPDAASDRCPSCGAPLDRVNAAGVCGYCDSVVTTGQFDWVLTRIDQAEGYSG